MGRHEAVWSNSCSKIDLADTPDRFRALPGVETGLRDRNIRVFESSKNHTKYQKTSERDAKYSSPTVVYEKMIYSEARHGSQHAGRKNAYLEGRKLRHLESSHVTTTAGNMRPDGRREAYL